jgi:hypothetical protein
MDKETSAGNRKLECLVDAIGNLHGAFADPDAQAYKLRNPLMVRSFARPGKHESDLTGHRVFTSLLAGYRAAVFDLEKKLEGNSRARIKPDTDCLHNLLAVYEVRGEANVMKVVSFLRKALSNPAIQASTPLTYFIE